MDFHSTRHVGRYSSIINTHLSWLARQDSSVDETGDKRAEDPPFPWDGEDLVMPPPVGEWLVELQYSILRWGIDGVRGKRSRTLTEFCIVGDLRVCGQWSELVGDSLLWSDDGTVRERLRFGLTTEPRPRVKAEMTVPKRLWSRCNNNTSIFKWHLHKKIYWLEQLWPTYKDADKKPPRTADVTRR